MQTLHGRELNIGTTVERNATSPPATKYGVWFWDTDDDTLYAWDGDSWELVGGSIADFTWWDPAAPNPTPSAYDDEFADESGGVPVGWTEFDNDGELTVDEDIRGLVLANAGAASDVTGIFKLIPTWGDVMGDGFSVIAKICPIKTVGNNNLDCGIAFWEDATNNPTTCDITTFGMLAGNNTVGVRVMEFTDYDTHDSTPWNPALTSVPNPTSYWIRVRCYTINILAAEYHYYLDISTDGLSWIGVYTQECAFMPAEFGLFVRGDLVNMRAIFPFFRVGDNGYYSIVEGDRVKGFIS